MFYWQFSFAFEFPHSSATVLCAAIAAAANICFGKSWSVSARCKKRQSGSMRQQQES
jgi:hypothetical protein